MLYRVLLFQKIHPKHGLIFLISGAVMAFFSFFCEIARPLPAYAWELSPRTHTWKMYERFYNIHIRSEWAGQLEEYYRQFTESTGFQPIFLLIAIILLLILAIQLKHLKRIRKEARPTQKERGIQIYQTGLPSPFSFRNNVFIPADLPEKYQPHVLAHEIGHAQNHHFSELLWVQLMLCTQWYNPFFWLLLHEIRLLQEFQADTEALASNLDRREYQLSLIEMTTGQENLLSFKAYFAQSSIKQRIRFMNTHIISKVSLPRMLAALIAIGIVSLITIGCQPEIQTEKPIDNSTPEHPLYGTWIRKAAIAEGESGPVASMNMYYKIFGNNTALLLQYDYGGAKSISARFMGRTIDFTYVNDTLVREDGKDIHIKLIDKSHFSLTWERHTTNIYDEPITDTVTELWERAETPKGILNVTQFRPEQ